MGRVNYEFSMFTMLTQLCVFFFYTRATTHKLSVQNHVKSVHTHVVLCLAITRHIWRCTRPCSMPLDFSVGSSGRRRKKRAYVETIASVDTFNDAFLSFNCKNKKPRSDRYEYNNPVLCLLNGLILNRYRYCRREQTVTAACREKRIKREKKIIYSFFFHNKSNVIFIKMAFLMCILDTAYSSYARCICILKRRFFNVNNEIAFAYTINIYTHTTCRRVLCFQIGKLK